MQVTLAGYNLDSEIINQVSKIQETYRHAPNDREDIANQLSILQDEPLTPEVLSAAYARISRSDKGISELRRDTRASVSRARRTNERIVFGYGHLSVAEHAMLNLDITGISRLALEELEAHRLASYTEASQRYIAMSGDYIEPPELVDTETKERFRRDCDALFAGYRELIEKLERHFSDQSERERHIHAWEDARYVLPLACRSQVGVTINARVAESMIRNLHRSPLREVHQMGQEMLNAIKRVIPSLIRYTQPNDSLRKAQGEIAHYCRNQFPPSDPMNEPDVVLVESPPNAEKTALAAILFNAGQGSFSACLEKVGTMDPLERKKLIINAHNCISAHEPLRREMELGYFTYSITLSASAFAQFKRHRIATIIKQNYLPELGYTAPLNIVEAGIEDIFKHCMNISNDLHVYLKNKLPADQTCAATYALTNAHRRRIIFQANARELTHFSRLREDINAQWDIRNIARKMIHFAREACPALMLFAAGKDTYDKLSEELFGTGAI